ncbi:MAG: electron transfer flavoprotein subunit alpha/FixB family protein [Acidobacteria bacterium]|nr:MAG: electron transfer flavoprotein subunit alpha/FixB family protein [Acidobacteriota bacterium]
MADVFLAIAEHEEGKIRRASLEALALARRLAAERGGRAAAAVLAAEPAPLAEELARRGADEVFALAGTALEPYTPDAYRLALAPLIRELSPEWVLMAHTYLAQDMLPTLAAGFGAPVISDCVDCETDADPVVFVRTPYDAKFVARTVDRGPAPRFATLQSGAFSADDLPDDHSGTVTRRDVAVDEGALRRRVIEVREAGGRGVDLSSAEIIVAGGRGLGSKENFDKLVGGLAKALGAAIGASRPVVDSEWLPHEHQIGSSGQIVSPRLYVALGISGAIQHMVGMRGSQVIVSINKDKDAPIFNESTYGIVGDVTEVVPELIKAVEEARSQ